MERKIQNLKIRTQEIQNLLKNIIGGTSEKKSSIQIRFENHDSFSLKKWGQHVKNANFLVILSCELSFIFQDSEEKKNARDHRLKS